MIREELRSVWESVSGCSSLIGLCGWRHGSVWESVSSCPSLISLCGWRHACLLPPLLTSQAAAAPRLLEDHLQLGCMTMNLRVCLISDSCSGYKTNIIVGEGSKISHIPYFFSRASKFSQQIGILVFIECTWAFFFLFHEQYSLRASVLNMINNLGKRTCLDYKHMLPHLYVNLNMHGVGSPEGLVLIPWDKQGQLNPYWNIH